MILLIKAEDVFLCYSTIVYYTHSTRAIIVYADISIVWDDQMFRIPGVAFCGIIDRTSPA